MGKYRRKPNVVDAFKWTGGPDQTEDPEWFIDCLRSGLANVCKDIEEVSFYDSNGPESDVMAVWIEIQTPSGTLRADQGDYIVMTADRTVHPCKPDIFEANHEIIEHDND